MILSNRFRNHKSLDVVRGGTQHELNARKEASPSLFRSLSLSLSLSLSSLSLSLSLSLYISLPLSLPRFLSLFRSLAPSLSLFFSLPLSFSLSLSISLCPSVSVSVSLSRSPLGTHHINAQDPGSISMGCVFSSRKFAEEKLPSPLYRNKRALLRRTLQ